MRYVICIQCHIFAKQENVLKNRVFGRPRVHADTASIAMMQTQMYVHTHPHTHAQTYTDTHTHTYRHTHTHTHTHTHHTHAWERTGPCRYTRMHMHAQKGTHTCMHMQTCLTTKTCQAAIIDKERLGQREERATG
jgi:hypothetical protein